MTILLATGYGVPSLEGKPPSCPRPACGERFLDPVYTGKAMAGYRQLLSQGRYDGVDNVLFLQTGGAPSLFTAAMEEMS